MLLSEKEMFDRVNFNSDCCMVAEYICKYYGKMYSLEDAMLIAKYLMLEKKFTKESILNGYADTDFIIPRGKLIVAREKSVRDANEKIIEVKLKTKKGLIDKKILIGIIAAFTIAAGCCTMFALRFNNSDEKLERATTVKLGQLASDNYEEISTIIGQNGPLNRDEQGNFIPTNEGIASDIVNVCAKDPMLFDVTIFNTYYNISSNRLDTFNEIWNTMLSYMANDPAFSQIYAKIGNQPFLGYVLNMLATRGSVLNFKPEYQKYANVINAYSLVQSYEELSKEDKTTIQEMMNKYYELGQDLYKSSKKTINNLVEEGKKASR